MNFNRNFKLTSLCLLISLSLFGCKKKPGEDYLEPVNVSNTSGESTDPSIAVDSKGTVHIVWKDDTPENKGILYSFKRKGGRWSKPVNLSNASRASSRPQLKVDENDCLHLVWDWSSREIFYLRKPENGKWSSPETIKTVEYALSPEIDVDPLGRVFIVWEAFELMDEWLYFSMREVNGTWQAPMPISSRTISGITGNAIKVDKNGNVYVAWIQHVRGKGNYVFYIVRDMNGHWSEPLPILPSDSSAFFLRPALTSDREGNIHISWCSHDMGFTYMCKPAQGNWQPPEHPEEFGFPWDIGVDENGTVYICYNFTKLVKKPKNGNWEAPFIVTKRRDDYPSSLAIDNEGIKHITWHSRPVDTLPNTEVYYVKVKDY